MQPTLGRLRSTIFLLLPVIQANVYKYDEVTLRPDTVQYRRVGMWAPADAPAAKHGVSREDDQSAEVFVELQFERTEVRHAGSLQVLLFDAEQLDRVGTVASGNRVYCCSPALLAHHAKQQTKNAAATAPITGCSAASAGKIIVAPEGTANAFGAHAHHHHRHISEYGIAFAANQSEASLTVHIPIRQSGVHYLLISSCNPKTGLVRFSGETQWRNPYGYLPAELYAFLPFFGALTLAYLVLAVGWALLCARHWHHLLPLQSAIAGVLLLCVVEGGAWYLAYRAFNEGGVRGRLPTIIGVLLSASRRTISRLLVLSVCLGYGVVRPTLAADVFSRVALLGGVYFAASAVLDVASNTSRLEELALPTRLLLVTSVGALDALFFGWCFSALSSTLKQLSSRRQSAKLRLYRRFSRVLGVLLVVSALWVSWQMVFIVSDFLDERWRVLWTFDAFWHVLYAAMLLTICVLWAPSESNLQHIYMDELGQEPEEEDTERESIER